MRCDHPTQKQLAPLASKLESEADKPDPALQKQIEQIAKSNGFSTLDEFDDVAANISLVLGGLDPQSGQFTEPPDQIKKDIAALFNASCILAEMKSRTCFFGELDLPELRLILAILLTLGDG